MSRRYLGNAFSAGMLALPEFGAIPVTFAALTLSQARAWLGRGSYTSCVGHADTALLLSALLERTIEMRRESTELHEGDQILIAQYNGPRLPEGARSLPEGARIRWILAAYTSHEDVASSWGES